MLLAVIMLALSAACAANPPAQTQSSGPLPSTSSSPSPSPMGRTPVSSATTTAASTAGPPSPTTVPAAAEPVCSTQVLQDAVNAERAPDKQLSVSETDVHCQDGWAAIGANDPVNKAQYTFLLQWVDGQWQVVPDRTQACASGELPAQLVNLGCHSN